MILPYDDLGSGPAIVLLHAGIADRTMWAEQLEPIAAAGFRVVAPDLPGFGDAPETRVAAAWTDVLETMDALQIERAAIVGVSFGGGTALRVAAVAPERVSALVLVGARPPGVEPSPVLRAAWDAEEEAIERGDIEAATLAVVDAWVGTGAPAPLRERVAAMQRRAFEIQVGADEPEEAPDPLEALAPLGMPTLVAYGSDDMPDFKTGAETLARGLGGRLEAIAGARHLAPLEQPDAFRALLLEFL